MQFWHKALPALWKGPQGYGYRGLAISQTLIFDLDTTVQAVT